MFVSYVSFSLGLYNAIAVWRIVRGLLEKSKRTRSENCRTYGTSAIFLCWPSRGRRATSAQNRPSGHQAVIPNGQVGVATNFLKAAAFRSQLSFGRRSHATGTTQLSFIHLPRLLRCKSAPRRARAGIRIWFWRLWTGLWHSHVRLYAAARRLFFRYVYLYSGRADKNLSFPFGRLTAIGIAADLITNIAAVAWYTDVTILGGTLGFAAATPYGSDTNSAAISFIGPLRVSRQLNRRERAAAIGDTAFSAILGWEAGEHQWNVAFTGIAPTGKYSPDSLAFMGLNRPAFDIKGGYTFLSMETGTKLSAAAGVTFNLRNTATDYQTGTEFHLEAALNQHFPFGLAAGVGGYFYQQLSGDSGSGAVLGPFRGRVAAVGPLLAYTFKVDTQQVTLSGRWFHEFDVKRRVRGDAIFASLSFPL